MAEHKIVLASVAPGSEAAVTAAFAKVLGLAEEGARPLVTSAPIILLDGLEADQAQAIVSAMAAAKQAGGNLVISGAPGQNMRSVNWPAPPKVDGREIASFKGGAAPPRPSSGIRQAVAPAVPRSTPSPVPPPAAVPSLSIVCPHCGKAIVLQTSGTGLGAQAPQSVVETDNVGKALPEVPDVQGQVEAPPPGSVVRTSPMDLEEFERGVGGGGPLPQASDTLLRQLDRALDQPPGQPPPQAQPKPRAQPKPKPRPKKPPSPSSGRSGRTRPRSPGGATERLRGRDRKRRR